MPDAICGLYPAAGVRRACPRPLVFVWSNLQLVECHGEGRRSEGGVQRAAADRGVMVVAPDTSPRGPDVAHDTAYDLGQGAGLYLTATEDPWAAYYRTDQYVVDELPTLVAAHFPADMARQGTFGHSMGGHGALTLHLKHPETYRSVSAFAPIVAPSQIPWGQKAFTHYLGEDRTKWGVYDACALVKERPSRAHILIDQGAADQFLEQELRPDLFDEACRAAGQDLTLRRQAGYDHSYYFISSFMADHIAHHAKALQ